MYEMVCHFSTFLKSLDQVNIYSLNKYLQTAT